MTEVVIVSAVRSAVGRGKTDGALAGVHPVELSSRLMRAAVDRVRVDPAIVDDVLWGCAMPEAGQGLNVARLSLLRAGFPVEVPGATINRFCSSGLQTIAFGAQEILSGMADVVLAGGIEMMSQVPMSGYHTRLDPEGRGELHRHGIHRRARGATVEGVARGAGRLGARQPAEGGEGARQRRVPRADHSRAGDPSRMEGCPEDRGHGGLRRGRTATPRHDHGRAGQAAPRLQGERNRDRRQMRVRTRMGPPRCC